MRGYLVVLSSLLPATLLAQGRILPAPCFMPVDSRIVQPPPPPRAIPCTGQVARVRSDVRAELVGSGASRVVRYEVDERFVNTGGRLGEADYVFPLPKGAAFQDLKLSINGELVAGETMNATDARRIYEEIVRRQRDPALVEWMGYGLLHARIFPINPGEEKRVVVRFQMVAQREGDAMRIDYFRGGDSARSSFVLTLPSGSGLGTPYSPTHTLDVADDGSQRTVRVNGDASDVTLLVPVRPRNEPAISMLANSPGGEDGYALITLAPPTIAREDETPRDVTLVLDVSGSMSGVKMSQARAAGRQLLGTLHIRDRFRLIDFSSDVHTFRDDFVPATAENLRAAARYLDALEAQGGTNIAGALREALGRSGGGAGGGGDDGDDRRLSVVLFVTDGEPTIGESDPGRIADEAGRERGDARVFTFGVGSDVNVTLLEQLALQGRGTAQFVRPNESVERAVGIVAARIAEPVLTDARVHTEGGVQLSKILPQQPVDLFAGQDLVLLARYAGHGTARVVFEGKRRGESVRWASTVDFPDRERENSFVPRLWAAQRIGWLAAEKRKNGGSTELDQEIRTLGERFGIPTEFTSYLVQEPGVVAQNRGVPPSAAPAPSRDMMFERAKAASEQRAATSVAALDEIVVTSATAGRGVAQKRVGARTFVLRDSAWTDASYVPAAPSVRTIRIKAYSPAYFDLMDALPELRPIFALGDRVVAKGRTVAIAVGADGAEKLGAAELSDVARGW